MDHEPVELGKGAFVDQRLDALSRRELSPRVLSRERLASGGNRRFRAFYLEFCIFVRATLHDLPPVGEALGSLFENSGLMLRVSCCIFALAVVGAIPAGFPSPPPIPPQRAVAESIYGTSVTDPYRYFENMADPVVAQFFKEQNDYARAVLAKLGEPRERLFERIKALDNAGAVVTGVTRDGPYYFYEKLNPGDNGPKLFVRNVDGSGERALVDPQTLATPGKHYTINYFLPSLDGRYVAYGISEGGSEAEVIHVVETATARVLPDAIDRAYYIGPTSWLSDGTSFYYVRFPKMLAGEAQTDKEKRAVAYLHVLGRDPDRDVAVFGYGVNPKIPFGLTDFPVVLRSPASPYTLAVIVHGVANERTVYATRATVLDSNVAWSARRDACRRHRQSRFQRLDVLRVHA